MGFPSVYGGVLPLMVVNTAVSLALVRNLVDALLRIVGLKPREDEQERQQQQRIAEQQQQAASFHYPQQDISSSSSMSFVEEVQASLPLIEFQQLLADGFQIADQDSLEEKPQCAVCLSDFEDSHLVRKLPRCSHVFHGDCLDKWLAHNQTSCPMCRASLLTDDLARIHKQREDFLAEELALWLSVYHTSALSRGPWWYRGHGSGLAGWDFH